MQISKTDKIFIAGGTGFLGSNLIVELKNNGYKNVDWTYGRDAIDFRDKGATEKFFRNKSYNHVINCCGYVGGIVKNISEPATMFADNMRICLNLMDACSSINGKYLQIGTVCSYPAFPKTVPFIEDELFTGLPDKSNRAYGVCRLSVLTALEAYKEQYGLNSLYLVPINMVGPYDDFSDGCHVIPDLIKKFDSALDRGETVVKLLGDSLVTREFVDVRDVARAMRLALENYNSLEPVNIGTGKEITILELAQRIAARMNFNGKLEFEPNSPGGQRRRVLSVERAAKEFGFRAEIDLYKSLDDTINYYYRNIKGKI